MAADVVSLNKHMKEAFETLRKNLEEMDSDEIASFCVSISFKNKEWIFFSHELDWHHLGHLQAQMNSIGKEFLDSVVEPYDPTDSNKE